MGEIEKGQRWQHVKRGTSYEVIGLAELQIASHDLVDGSELVVYRGDDGKLWAREESEFADGRFCLASTQEPATGEIDTERLHKIIDKIDQQAKCLEGYAEQDGHSGKAPASVYHWQATHFRDIGAELRKAVAALQTPASPFPREEVERTIRLCNERAETYGALRTSSLTAIALDRASTQLAALLQRSGR